jgi:hypothetical protein
MLLEVPCIAIAMRVVGMIVGMRAPRSLADSRLGYRFPFDVEV